MQVTFTSAPASGSGTMSHTYCWAKDHCQPRIILWPRDEQMSARATTWILSHMTMLSALPRIPLDFNTFLWSLLSCHTVLWQSGHRGGEEQWLAEALYRAACWGGGLHMVHKIQLLKSYKEQHVRAAAVVLGLS